MSSVDTSLLSQLGLNAWGNSATAATAGSQNGSGQVGSSQLNQSDFLKLMTTQLNNQDPTQPTDSSQMLAQMAQLSTVSGIQDMQGSLKQLADTLLASQTTQAASLVGHEVVAPGSKATLGANGLSGAIDLTQDTSQLALVIYDSSGQLVKQINLGAQSKGTIPFSWDGVMANGATAPSGLYQIKAIAGLNGSQQQMNTLVATTVNSVSVDGTSQNITLNTSNGDGVKISDIKQLM